MALIRAINKSNKSNNNNNNNSNGSANQTSSTTTSNVNNTTNKVVIVAPPTPSQLQQQSSSSTAVAAMTSSLQVSQNANNNNNNNSSNNSNNNPVSPSASLPPLKKRTTIVKQAVPPPPPPRKSSPAPPRSTKSNSIPYCTSRIIVDVDRLHSLSSMEIQNGNLKVKKWLESVELPLPSLSSLPTQHDEILIRSDDVEDGDDDVTFKGVKKLIESFTSSSYNNIKDEKYLKSNVNNHNNKKKRNKSGRRVSDLSLVQARIEGYNTLERKARNQSNVVLKSETDSGIEISSKSTHLLRFHHQFSRDGEFV